MVDTYSGTVPNLTQTQPDFDTNTQNILDYIASLAPQLNEWVGAYVQDTTTVSSTEHTLGTGSKIFTVEAGKGYKEDMTVRASAGGGNFMDGLVTAYSGTSLTVNFSNFNGSGTFSDWDIYLNISGGATLESNTFTGDQFVPDEAYDATGWNGDLSVPTKNAVRDKIEAILGAILNATNDPTYASTSGSNAASPEWTIGFVGANTGAKLLGTLTTTSGTTQTLSGLNLTGYKFVEIWFQDVSSSANAQVTMGGQAITDSLVSVGNAFSGDAVIELASGIMSSKLTRHGVPLTNINTTAPWITQVGVNSASTSITFGISAGTFDLGSIRIYGRR